MRLQLGSVYFPLQVCVSLALATLVVTGEQEKKITMPLIDGPLITAAGSRSAGIADDVQGRKSARLFEDDKDDKHRKSHRTHINLANFGTTGLLHGEESALKKNSQHQYSARQDSMFHDIDDIFPGVRVRSGNPTTMLPTLTTLRDTRLFDFVPVNLIREDAKGNPFVPFKNKNFEDLGDVNLVPAGSNTRIQVKKGPNGKDYEYEYVYYYYDEEDEGKADDGATASNSQEIPTRASVPNNSKREGNSNRNKYSTLDRTFVASTTTVEPVINEVIPSGNSNRARQLEVAISHEEVSAERLPTNTRFPPRARVNHIADTTERTSRGRGNRQRTAAFEATDTSSFRGSNGEGPEFPQNLPNGPVRFLGVTPNESNEEKVTTSIRSRGRPQQIQVPAPVQENYDDSTFTRKQPSAAQYESMEQHDRDQSQFHQQPYLSKDDETANYAVTVSANLSPRNFADEKDAYMDVVTDSADITTTQVVHAMDKVALDLYAFLQQGRSNLVDFVKEADDVIDSTDLSGDILTTELPGTPFLGTASSDETTLTTTAPSITSSRSTNTNISTPTTSSTPRPVLLTSSEEPREETLGRNKFRRPGIGGSAISRNRFKSHSSSSSANSTDAAPIEATSPTQRARGRLGTNSASGIGGFKRARPSLHKSVIVPTSSEEPSVRKDSTETLDAEAKPVTGRGRYRGGLARSGQHTRTTVALVTDKQISASTDKTPSSMGSNHKATSNKLGSINRRRGNKPGASIPSVAEEAPVAEQITSPVSLAQENSNDERQTNRSVTKRPLNGPRAKPLNKPIIKLGAGRLNLRPRLGQQTTTTTTESTTSNETALAEATVDEPASEGTEEETREAPVESSLVARLTTVNPFNKLRNRNRIQVHPKVTTARTPLPPAARRSHLLPRRKTTEAPTAEFTESTEPVTISSSSDESVNLMESQPQQQTEASNVKHEESRGLSSLLAPRRRIASRRPGQPFASLPAAAD